jgi:hypothetical protein
MKQVIVAEPIGGSRRRLSGQDPIWMDKNMQVGGGDERSQC